MRMCCPFGVLHPKHFENKKVMLSVQIFNETEVAVFNLQGSVKTANLSH